MITRDTITRIMDAVRIEEVVGDFITLKRRGANMLGNCPFHNEKTPSFTVSPAKGIYKCFGCGAAGDSVKFIIEHEHKTYPEALRYLAEKYHIEIEETEAPSDKQIEEKNERDSLLIVSAFAQRYYTEQLLETEEGRNIGLTYFKERGFTKETIERFQLGYSPEKGDALVKAAQEQGYQVEFLQKAGLASDKYDRPYDFFRGRVMFTIHNFTGKVVGFGGRTLLSDKKVPKYVNTPETEIYNKSRILYGLFQAKNAIRKEDECILVEGYTDVISLSQAGVENVVASSGTSLTVEQVRLIKRLTPNITITYDGDTAGIKAALRGIDLILEEDMNVRVVLLPPEDDPDSYVKREGANGFLKYRNEHIQDFILFMAKFLVKGLENDPIKKSEALYEVILTLSKVKSQFKRAFYVTECSQFFGISETLLHAEINKIIFNKIKENKPLPIITGDSNVVFGSPNYSSLSSFEPIVGQKENYLDLQEKQVLRLLLEYGSWPYSENVSVTHAIVFELDRDEITFNGANNDILEIIKEGLRNDEVRDATYFLALNENSLVSYVIDILHSIHYISENWEKRHSISITDPKFVYKLDINSTIVLLKLRYIFFKYKEISKQLTGAIGDDDKERVVELIQLKMYYDALKKDIASTRGIVYLPF